MMADKPYNPVIIGALVGLAVAATGALYYVVLTFVPGGAVLRWIILAGTVVALGALVYVVRQRLQEIEQEDPDDYRKY
jgi:energy-converting hydrogenase Eha subunit G